MTGVSIYNKRLAAVCGAWRPDLLRPSARSIVSLDVYNALNTDALINVNQSFATWMRPTEILNARLLKLSVQFDF